MLVFCSSQRISCSTWEPSCTALSRHLVPLTVAALYPWWRHQMETFPRYWPFTGNRWIPLTKGQWRAALMFSLICAWINGWVNNREAGDLRRHRAHYDVTVISDAKDMARLVIHLLKALIFVCLNAVKTISPQSNMFIKKFIKLVLTSVSHWISLKLYQ